MENLNDTANVLSQWIEFGYKWVKSKKINSFPVSARIWKGVGKSTEKQILMGAGSSAWHRSAGPGHGCSSEGMTCPRAWQHLFVNRDPHSAEVVPTLPYSALLLHPACTCPESMAQRLSRVGWLGDVSQLHKYNLTRKEALSSFFPWAQPKRKEL